MIAVILALMLTSIGLLLVFSILDDDGRRIEEPRKIFYSASDGAIINGTFYPSPDKGAPMVYLIHDIGGSRQDFGDYPLELQEDGLNVLVIDLRGHGESTINIKSGDITYDWTTMEHIDFLGISNDIFGAYEWVYGDSPVSGEPNTDAGPDGAFIGIGKGGLYAMNRFALMSRQRILSGTIISPTLNCYGLDVERVFENWGDVFPILLAASQGDGTGEMAMNTILTRKENDDEKNGIGVFVPGSKVGSVLLNDEDLKEQISLVLELGWEVEAPGGR
jgi:pimeloyl-ACP methyl ester carboxylesterase